MHQNNTHIVTSSYSGLVPNVTLPKFCSIHPHIELNRIWCPVLDVLISPTSERIRKWLGQQIVGQCQRGPAPDCGDQRCWEGRPGSRPCWEAHCPSRRAWSLPATPSLLHPYSRCTLERIHDIWDDCEQYGWGCLAARKVAAWCGHRSSQHSRPRLGVRLLPGRQLKPHRLTPCR